MTRYAVKYAPGKRLAVKTLIGRYPSVLLPFARLLFNTSDATGQHITGRDLVRKSVVRKDTEIVIEGAHRSANTFAVAAFKLAQTRPVKMAYRLHAPAQVLAAVRMDVPALVLIRDPQETVLSFVVHQSANNLTIEQALRTWISFYETVLPYRDRFVLGPFDEVVTDFGTVIQQVNRFFGTSFDDFAHTEDNVARCFELIKEGYGESAEKRVAVPSKEREDLKDALRKEFRSRRLAPMREKAYDIYAEMTRDPTAGG